MVDDLVTGSDGLGGPPGERWRISSLRSQCSVFSVRFSVNPYVLSCLN